MLCIEDYLFIKYFIIGVISKLIIAIFLTSQEILTI